MWDERRIPLHFRNLYLYLPQTCTFYMRDEEIPAHTIPCCVEDYNFQMQPNIAQSAHSAGQSHTSRDANQWNWNEQHQIGLYNYIVCVYKKMPRGWIVSNARFIKLHTMCAIQTILCSLSFLEEIRGKRWARRDYEISYSYRQYAAA